MFNRIHRVLFVALAASLLAGCSAGTSTSQLPTADNNPPQPVPIVGLTMGNNSKITEPTVALITSKAQLASYQMAGDSDDLNVNFDKQNAILVALGTKNTGGYWVKITGVQQIGNKLYFQALANKPAKGQASSQGITHPYCLAVIPKTSATELTSEVQAVVGQPVPKDDDTPGDQDHN